MPEIHNYVLKYIQNIKSYPCTFPSSVVGFLKCNSIPGELGGTRLQESGKFKLDTDKNCKLQKSQATYYDRYSFGFCIYYCSMFGTML